MNQLQLTLVYPMCVPNVPGGILWQGLLPARMRGNEAAQVGGSCRKFSLTLQHLKIWGGGGGNHCNSGEKWCFNSYQSSFLLTAGFLCPLPCCWRQERQLTPQRAARAMPEVLTKQEVRHQTWTGNERHHQIISPCRDLVQTCLRDSYL